MVEKTFISVEAIKDLKPYIMDSIQAINGTNILSKKNEIQWEFQYEQYRILCTAFIEIDEIKIKAVNLDNFSKGESFAINKFYNALSSRLIIREKSSVGHLIKIDNHNSSKWTTKQILGIFIISIVVFWVLGYFLSDDKSIKKSNTSSNSSFSSISTRITKSGYKASYSEASLQKLVECSVHRDYQCINQLIYRGEIFELPAGLETYIVKGSFSGKVKIRLKGESQDIWTFSEAIKHE